MTGYEAAKAKYALAAFRSFSSPAAIICAAKFPTAVASVGPAYTFFPAYSAVSSFK